MNHEKRTFYITTAIDYPNSVPHMGHAYEKVVADFYARCYRLQGRDTRFLIGLDEHGQKIQEAAEKEGKTPQAFVDEKAGAFRELYQLLSISNDDFIRTSEPRHHRFACHLFERVLSNGDIYKDVYHADYCISCERALTLSELVDGKCPVHDRPTTKVEEDSYFFRLSKYRDAVREHIESHPPFIVPDERRNEVLSRLQEEVLDLSISRSTFDWGVPLPNDPKHVMYVWFDALSNYVGALREPQDLEARFWPADCHVIGKDILWFHTVIWPAMLLSAGMPLPEQIYSHGFILDRDGRKMAKHLGNVVDPLDIVREYSADTLRFYLLRALSSTQDGRFSPDELRERYKSELGDELGNLVKRVAKLTVSRAGGELSPEESETQLDGSAVVEEFLEHVENRGHHRALDVLWSYVRRINKYLTDRQPWSVKEEPAVRKILYTALEALRTALHLLSPAMPGDARRAAKSLGFAIGTLDGLRPGQHTYRVRLADALFPRREAPKPPEQVVDPFAKLEIRVGQVDEVRPHPDADSLYAMTVDVGGDKRSICAGLRAHLQPEELHGRKVVVVANLKPAVLRGIESRGMILAADGPGGRVVPVDPGEAVSGDLVEVEGVEPRPKKKLSRRDFEKAPLLVQGGRVTYRGRPLTTPRGVLTCDAEDGSTVR